ncbi:MULTISPECIES: DUF4160 domain-containing protein, partial [unclassified Microcoleus]|uniref:DUF4160 domain-containing protein n=1 Tax=unclassified Microcoleus TaxID=2642155 RepID=UPI002FD11116
RPSFLDGRDAHPTFKSGSYLILIPKRDRQLAKFWMNPVSLEKNRGFKEHELNQIARLVEEYEQILLEAWHHYFDP